uniref:Suppressor APC domain containing 1 n=1 Tax=Pygocentrus nattereri TaxID=42514 RepID=A0AAR2ILU0_PYGNA
WEEPGEPGGGRTCRLHTERTSILSLRITKSTPSLSHFFFCWQVKKLQELERERDSLWMGLQALEQARAWLCCRLEENKQPWVGRDVYSCESLLIQIFLFQQQVSSNKKLANKNE